jgi:hypothetical protein
MLLLVLYGDFQEKTRWKPSVYFLFYQARAYSKLETVFYYWPPPWNNNYYWWYIHGGSLENGCPTPRDKPTRRIGEGGCP